MSTVDSSIEDIAIAARSYDAAKGEHERITKEYERNEKALEKQKTLLDDSLGKLRGAEAQIRKLCGAVVSGVVAK